MLTPQLISWIVFGIGITTMLMLDLGVFNSKDREIKMRDALLWSALWICSALVFACGIAVGWIDTSIPGYSSYTDALHEVRDVFKLPEGVLLSDKQTKRLAEFQEYHGTRLKTFQSSIERILTEKQLEAANEAEEAALERGKNPLGVRQAIDKAFKLSSEQHAELQEIERELLPKLELAIQEFEQILDPDQRKAWQEVRLQEKREVAWRATQEFLTGYIIEESLSVDNLFVFVIIFSYFKVPPAYQRRVLYWGILGAILMRALFIAAGIALIERFHFIIYIFGVFLVYTGIKLVIKDDDEFQPEKNIILRLFRRMWPVTNEYHGSNFFVKLDGKWTATPLVIVLLVVETTDLIFAVDSIPAILSITQNPFIVYTSNIFAIMGLRSLYFALQGLMDKFHYLKYGLSAILVFVGLKMLFDETLFHGYLKERPAIALGVVLFILAACMIASLLKPQSAHPSPNSNGGSDGAH